MEGLQRIELFARAQEFDRRAGDGCASKAPRRRGASPSTRVRMMPEILTRSLNDLGDIDRVLAGQRIGHQQGLVRVDQLP